MSVDKNDLTYWFPRLQSAGVPVPKTIIVDAGGICSDSSTTSKQFPDEHRKAEIVLKPLAAGIRKAVADLGGYPVFLRTGQTSGKHQWKETCDLSDDSVEDHVVSLVEFSEMADMMGGLSWRYWCVRERLPVTPIAVLSRYGNMPLVREIRAFVAGGQIVCHHGYWPRNAIRDGLPAHRLSVFDESTDPTREARADELYAASFMAPRAESESLRLAQAVAKIFADDGAWSVDILETDRGFFVTDMAIASRSFHWENCPHAAAMRAS